MSVAVAAILMLAQIIAEVAEMKIAKNWNKIAVEVVATPPKSTNFRADDCYKLKN